MPESRYYWDIMESSDPEIWPGSTPWGDRWGSFGSIPDAAGYGASVERIRVPAEAMESFWAEITRRYWRQLPRFMIGPRETPGLGRWLESHGYHRETSETVLVLHREAFHKIGPASCIVHEVKTVEDLRQVLALDHLVFRDSVPDSEGTARELARLGWRRRLFFIRGDDGIAKVAGGLTHFPGWSLLWGGETHPAFRRQGLYHAVLAARMHVIRQTNSTFTAVYANHETSMPILSKVGFETIGTIEVWKPAGMQSGRPI